ncbi:MAG: DUF2851 family protein [Cytophagaceae bacterium]
MMKESFLHFVWEFQYFEKKLLTDCFDEQVQIVHQGTKNYNSGPDFHDARIKIGDFFWSGNVEIHIKASDWYSHNHQQDKAYDNVILHVVWLNDQIVKRTDGTPIPTLELKNRIDPDLYEKYRQFINSPGTIPCGVDFNRISDIVKLSMLDRTLSERLQEKSAKVRSLLADNHGDWEETAYQLLALNMGFKLNSEPFLKLGQRLPLKILRKHADNEVQAEALLFGMAGLLDKEFKDEYPRTLKREFGFLAGKYQLKEKKLTGLEWKFMRIRPANFPSVRISEFAALILKNPSLFSVFKEVVNIKQLYNFLQVEQSTYWHTHYLFDRIAERKAIHLGKSAIENIAINTVAPLLACYAIEKDDQRYMDKSIELLESVSPEENRITKVWSDLGLHMASAFDTQAGIQLYNNYCRRKRCLECNLGVNLMNMG